MNKQLKQLSQKLNEKLSSCTDELSSLLDLIYKFPQKQREIYYDRIQLLKQNLTQLKLCAKDIQSTTNFVALEKKYQHVLIKITELKNEITTYESNQPGKRRKSLMNDSAAFENLTQSMGHSDQKNRYKAGGGIKSQYDNIMETIVQKDEETKKYRSELEQMKKVVKECQEKEEMMKKNVQTMEKQLGQMRKIYSTSHSRNILLEKQVQQLNKTNEVLNNLCNRQKQSMQISQVEIKNLTKLLEEAGMHLKFKKSQAENSSIQLAALEEKYKYELKDYIQKVDLYKVKQRGYQKKIKELERDLEKKLNSEDQNAQLSAQNERLKQDIKVLQAELTAKQEQLYEKNKRIEAQKSELNFIKTTHDDQQRNFQFKDAHIKELSLIQKQNQNIITILEKRVKELEKCLAESDEAKLFYERRQKETDNIMRQLNSKVEEKDALIQQVRGRLAYKEQEIRRLQIISNQNQKKDGLISQEKTKLQKQLDRVTLQLSKSQKRFQELSQILQKNQNQRIALTRKVQQLQNSRVSQQQQYRKYQKQIQSLKKRLLRAKIQTIHNIREVIV